MARLAFTPHLRRHLGELPSQAAGATVRQVLEAVFAERPSLRSYLLDDQGCLRRHVVLFVDGERIADRTGLSDATGDDSELYIMQALSGG